MRLATGEGNRDEGVVASLHLVTFFAYLQFAYLQDWGVRGAIVFFLCGVVFGGYCCSFWLFNTRHVVEQPEELHSVPPPLN
jgi:hypothetical protein